MTAHELHTSRLLLRPCEGADLEALRDLWTEPEVRRWFWDGRVISEEEVKNAISASRHSFSESGAGIWTISLRDTGAFAGTAGLLTHSHPFFDREVLPPEETVTELFFAILPRHRNNGYATEAAGAILAYGFEAAGVETVVTIADEPNEASLKVIRRCGMSRTGSRVIDGQTIHLFSRSREDSKRSPD